MPIARRSAEEYPGSPREVHTSAHLRCVRACLQEDSTMRHSAVGLILTLAIVVAPLAAETPRQAMPVIGYLHFASPSLAPTPAVFLQGLREAGYVEGHNVAIEYRWAEGRYERLPALARDLVDRQVDVIAAFGPSAAHAAHSATS